MPSFTNLSLQLKPHLGPLESKALAGYTHGAPAAGSVNEKTAPCGEFGAAHKRPL
jgi:hypothetical protein